MSILNCSICAGTANLLNTNRAEFFKNRGHCMQLHIIQHLKLSTWTLARNTCAEFVLQNVLSTEIDLNMKSIL